MNTFLGMEIKTLPQETLDAMTQGREPIHMVEQETGNSVAFYQLPGNVIVVKEINIIKRDGEKKHELVRRTG